ncbi:MAG: hypothetical protein ACI9UV_002039 [Algoriphagus sp.]|jgi:hypothetical protein
MVNNGNAGTSVTRHRSSSQIAKEEEVTSIIADNQMFDSIPNPLIYLQCYSGDHSPNL